MIILLSFTLLTACHSGSKIDSQSTFISFFAGTLLKKFPHIKFTLNASTGILTAKTKGGDVDINTVNLYQRFQAHPDSLLVFLLVSSEQVKLANHE